MDSDLIAFCDEIRRDVHLLAVDREVSVANQLTSFGAGIRETGAVSDVVQAALKASSMLLPVTPFCVPPFKHESELLFEQTVDLLDFLLLAKLQTVLGELDTALAVLPRRIAATFERALFGVATIALQERASDFHGGKSGKLNHNNEP